MSTSLPVIQGLSPDQVRPRSKNIGSKYKYRSSYCEQDEDDESVTSPADLIDEDSIVNRFIKVVGTEQESGPQKSKKVVESSIVRSTSLSSREDIRKKLASFGEEETIPEEEDEDVMINPLDDAHSDEDEPQNSSGPDSISNL